MKKILSFLIVAVACVALTGCVASHNTIKSDYGLDDDHVYVGISYEDLISKAEANEVFIVFYGYPGCSNCVTNAPIADQYAKYYGVSVIYYLNSAKLKADEKKTIKSNYGIDTSHYPQFWLFQDNEIIISSYRDYIAESKTYPEAYRAIFKKYVELTTEAE